MLKPRKKILFIAFVFFISATAIFNGKLYAGPFGNIENGRGDSFDIDMNSRASLIEIYSPDNVLLHKWDFEGSTDDEKLSDKADTGNKINFSKKSEGFKLIPV